MSDNSGLRWRKRVGGGEEEEDRGGTERRLKTWDIYTPLVAISEQ